MIKKQNNKKSATSFILGKCVKLFENNLISIVLFGSYARENHSAYSDMDIIIILEKENNDDISKLRKEFLIRFEKKLDLQIFTKKEVIQNFNDFSPLFTTLLLGKQILFDRNMFFKKQFKEFTKKMMQMNIQYCEGKKTWQIQKIARNLEDLR